MNLLNLQATLRRSISASFGRYCRNVKRFNDIRLFGNERILIAGGGIGGLTLARACEIANIPYILFEKRDSFVEEGENGIGLWGPAERIMDTLGLGEQVRHHAMRMSCAGYRTQTGQWLAQPPSSAPRGDMRTCLTLLRSELMSTLRESIPQEKILTGHELVDFRLDETSQTMTAVCSNGSSYNGSLLVGADGIHSKVRQILYPQSNPSYCGYSYYRAVTTVPSNLKWHDSDASTAWETWGPSTRIAYVPLKNKAFWFVSLSMGEEAANEEFKRLLIQRQESKPATDRFTLGEAILSQLSGDWHEPIGDMLRNTPDSSIIFTPIRRIDLPASKFIHPEKRVVLLGDAAHAIPPNLASGALLSMMDAVQLASSLRQYFYPSNAKLGTSSTDRVRDTFRSYLNNRKASVSTIQQSSALVATVGQLRSSNLIKLRDSAILLVPLSVRNAIFRSMHRFFLGWNYTVPDLGQGLYARLFPRDEWSRMPKLLQAFHGLENSRSTGQIHSCGGWANSRRGHGFGRVISSTASLPPTLDRAVVHVELVQAPDGTETWKRTFTDRRDGGRRSYQFSTKQYIENEDFIEVVNPWPTISPFVVEVVMKLVPLAAGASSRENDIQFVGFNHVLRHVRVQLLPNLLPKALATFNAPSFATPRVAATTICDANNSSWNFDVVMKAPDSFLGRLLFRHHRNQQHRKHEAIASGDQIDDDPSIIGRYSGKISWFSKQTITDLQASERNSDESFKTVAGGSGSISSVRSVSEQPRGWNVLILGGYGLFGNRVASGILIDALWNQQPLPRVFVNSRNAYPPVHDSILNRVEEKLALARLVHEAGKHSFDAPRSELESSLVSELFDSSNAAVLEAKLRERKIDALVNCTGPFQHDTKLVIPSVCAKTGVHYVDISDARSHVLNFIQDEELNRLASESRVSLIAGASTVPGVSSAICSHLLNVSKIANVEYVEIAISPGNQTPRGLATMESILGQTGHPIPATGQPDFDSQNLLSWSGLKRSSSGDFHARMENARRLLCVLDCPDLSLLPSHIQTLTGQAKPHSLKFYAGLENEVMHCGLWMLGKLVRVGLVKDLSVYAKPLKQAAESKLLFASSGSDTGGMYVSMTGTTAADGKQGKKRLRAMWKIYAGSGEGLQIPAVASTLLVSKLRVKWMDAGKSGQLVADGTAPCVGVFTREEVMDILRPYDVEDCVSVEELQ